MNYELRITKKMAIKAICIATGLLLAISPALAAEVIGKFPSLLGSDGARAIDGDIVWLGESRDKESNSKQVDADSDDGISTNFNSCSASNASFIVHVEKPGKTEGVAYLNLWADWNRDGQWSGSDKCAAEWAVQNYEIDLSKQTEEISVHVPVFTAGENAENIWYRGVVSYNEKLTRSDGGGEFAAGEVEDYGPIVLKPVTKDGDNLRQPPPLPFGASCKPVFINHRESGVITVVAALGSDPIRNTALGRGLPPARDGKAQKLDNPLAPNTFGFTPHTDPPFRTQHAVVPIQVQFNQGGRQTLKCSVWIEHDGPLVPIPVPAPAPVPVPVPRDPDFDTLRVTPPPGPVAPPNVPSFDKRFFHHETETTKIVPGGEDSGPISEPFRLPLNVFNIPPLIQLIQPFWNPPLPSSGEPTTPTKEGTNPKPIPTTSTYCSPGDQTIYHGGEATIEVITSDPDFYNTAISSGDLNNRSGSSISTPDETITSVGNFPFSKYTYTSLLVHDLDPRVDNVTVDINVGFYNAATKKASTKKVSCNIAIIHSGTAPLPRGFFEETFYSLTPRIIPPTESPNIFQQFIDTVREGDLFSIPPLIQWAFPKLVGEEPEVVEIGDHETKLSITNADKAEKARREKEKLEQEAAAARAKQEAEEITVSCRPLATTSTVPHGTEQTLRIDINDGNEKNDFKLLGGVQLIGTDRSGKKYVLKRPENYEPILQNEIDSYFVKVGTNPKHVLPSPAIESIAFPFTVKFTQGEKGKTAVKTERQTSCVLNIQHDILPEEPTTPTGGKPGDDKSGGQKIILPPVIPPTETLNVFQRILVWFSLVPDPHGVRCAQGVSINHGEVGFFGAQTTGSAGELYGTSHWISDATMSARTDRQIITDVDDIDNNPLTQYIYIPTEDPPERTESGAVTIEVLFGDHYRTSVDCPVKVVHEFVIIEDPYVHLSEFSVLSTFDPSGLRPLPPTETLNIFNIPPFVQWIFPNFQIPGVTYTPPSGGGLPPASNPPVTIKVLPNPPVNIQGPTYSEEGRTLPPLEVFVQPFKGIINQVKTFTEGQVEYVQSIGQAIEDFLEDSAEKLESLPPPGPENYIGARRIRNLIFSPVIQGSVDLTGPEVVEIILPAPERILTLPSPTKPLEDLGIPISPFNFLSQRLLELSNDLIDLVSSVPPATDITQTNPRCLAVVSEDANQDNSYKFEAACRNYKSCSVTIRNLTAQGSLVSEKVLTLPANGELIARDRIPTSAAVAVVSSTCNGTTYSSFAHTYKAAGPASPSTLSVTTSSLADGTVSTAYSQTVSGQGGTLQYTWSVSAGSLPAGLSIAAGTGVISGTPTTAATSNFTITVTDANGLTASRALSIVVAAGSPSITTTSPLATANGNCTGITPFAATGGTTPYTWSLSGLNGVATANSTTVNANTGQLSCTIIGAGTAQWITTVTDANLNTATLNPTIQQQLP
ncbi:MAG: peptidase S8/S53 subtilisin kexin sedolisin [Parcubacteria group bacterium Gr01-1014_19]|nr:MAG: peptidase S8/S53 subtilisin kexin sedolisin [Parcubacteria group bacterium Gr01-1014_19]